MENSKIVKLLKWVLPALAAALFVYYPITDSDIFWHLVSGREMVAQKTFFNTDPFSYTTPETTTWINLHWLFQTVMFGVYSSGGLNGLLVIKAAILFLCTIILFRSVKRRKFPILELSVFLIALYIFRYLVPMRPVLFTLLFISLFFYLLERFCRTAKPVNLLLLLPLQILWTNSQGLYWLGPVLCGCFFFGEIINSVLSVKAHDLFSYKPVPGKKQMLFFAVILMLLPAVSVINPYGTDGLLFPFRLFLQINPSMKNIYSANIIENTPLLSMTGTRYTGYVVTFLLITASAVLSLAFSPGWIRFSHLFCVICFTIPAYMAQRNLILYLFVLVPLVLWNTDHISLKPVMKSRKAYKIVMIIFVFLPVFCLIQHLRLLQSCSGNIAPFTHPVNSAEYLVRNSVEGNVFNADRYGGYLLWKLYPDKKVFIDTRLSLRSREFFAEYLAIVDYPALFAPTAQKFNITQVVLPLATVDRYKELIKMLHNDKNWALAWTDGAEVLFIADSLCGSEIDLSRKGVVDSIEKTIVKRMPDRKLSDEALFYFKKFLSDIDTK